MKSLPELLALSLAVALCGASIVFAEPPTVVEPWCPTVAPVEPGCTAEACADIERSVCEKQFGPGAIALSWCKPEWRR